MSEQLYCARCGAENPRGAGSCKTCQLPLKLPAVLPGSTPRAGRRTHCMSCGVEGEMAAGTCASCGSRLYVERADAHLERKARGDDALTRALIPVNVPSIAMVAGYLGLLSILIFPAPGALIAGIVGVVHLRKHPEKSGMGRCITGIVLGLLFSVIGAAMLFDII